MDKIYIQFNEDCRFYRSDFFSTETELTIITLNTPIIIYIEGKLSLTQVCGVRFARRKDDKGKKHVVMEYSINYDESNYIGYYSVLELNVSGCDYIDELFNGAGGGHNRISVAVMQTWPKTRM